MPTKGEVRGPQLQPREAVALTYAAGWQEPIHLHQAVSIWGAESLWSVRSFNDNLDADGQDVLSRDVGLCQINIPAEQIGTAAEERLYDPATCLAAARKLYEARGWQPWVAFNTGVYKHAVYSAQASLGVMNWLLEEMGSVKVPVFTSADLRAKKLW